jgi:hypothetical protein
VRAKREQAKTFAEMVDEVPETRRSPHQISSLNVIADREWFDQNGKRWHMRGRPLDLKQARRVLNRRDVPIAHFDCYGPDAIVAGSERDALIGRVRESLDEGPFGGGNGFVLAEFRDDDGNDILVIEGDCC